jgi:hypothetical protein
MDMHGFQPTIKKLFCRLPPSRRRHATIPIPVLLLSYFDDIKQKLMIKNNSFPDYFPPCCPPEDSIDADGVVFRIVKTIDLSDDDFYSHHELGKTIAKKECSCCGVSVFNSHKSALHRQNITPKLGNVVTEGTFNSSAGKILLTSKVSGHIDWWPYDGVDRKSFFGHPQSCN